MEFLILDVSTQVLNPEVFDIPANKNRIKNESTQLKNIKKVLLKTISLRIIHR